MRWLKDTEARLVEDALTLPILLLIAVAMVNIFLYGVASVSAYNAAEYAARKASVARANVAGVAVNAAWERLNALPIGAQFRVQVVAASPHRGAVNTVVVSYTVPNYFRGLTAIFGVSMPSTIQGKAVSYFRHEGWR